MEQKICVITSGGGHLKEVELAIELLDSDNVYYVTNYLPHLRKTLKGKKLYFIVDPHLNIIKYAINCLQSLVIYLFNRPNIIITSGAGIAIPMCLLGRIFRSKIVFIESGSRINYPSRTGKFLYKYSDYFIIQSEKLQKIYPKAILKKAL